MDSSTLPRYTLLGSLLCKDCQTILDPHADRRNRHYPDFTDLLASSEAGCDLCTRYLKYLESRTRRHGGGLGTSVLQHSLRGARETNPRKSVAFPVLADPSSRAEYGLTMSIGADLFNQMSLTILNSHCDDYDKEAEHRPCNDLLSKCHLDLIKRWRKECHDRHDICQEPAKAQPLPSRVLEIIDPNNKDAGTRLVETGGTMEGKYACLSYCWGNDATGSTVKSNLSTYIKAIPESDLPPIVIDAIRLCFTLGIQYLWVDRLCIIQDNKKEWEDEASKMCDIYSRSALTIAVPICRTSGQSFLEERKNSCLFTDEENYTKIDYEDRKLGLKGRLLLGLQSKTLNESHWFLESVAFSAKKCEKDHWLSRGWTFQEWLLSPRVLHIDNMTMWDCFEGYANELNRRHVEAARYPRHPAKFGSKPWGSIVEEYSDRRLTNHTDRLLALKGLAKRYGRDKEWTYISGLWSEELPGSLFWQRRTTRQLPPREPKQSWWDWVCQICKREPNRTPPSWSWASSNSSVYFPHGAYSRSVCDANFGPDGPIVGVDNEAKRWIDVKGDIRVVTGQKMVSGECHIEVGNNEFLSIPDNDRKYEDAQLAKSNIYLLTLEWKYQYDGDARYELGSLVLQGLGKDLWSWKNLWPEKNQSPPCYKRLGTVVPETEVQKSPRFGPSSDLKTIRLI